MKPQNSIKTIELMVDRFKPIVEEVVALKLNDVHIKSKLAEVLS